MPRRFGSYRGGGCRHPSAAGAAPEGHRWVGGSAAGAADFLNRLAQAEARDASSLEGPTPSPTSPKGSPKGPRVRHLSIGELTIERPSVGRAIEDLTLAEEERTSSTSPAVKRLSSSSTSPAVACPSLTTAADTAIPIPPPLPVRRGGVGPPRLASESPPEAGSLRSRLHGGVTRALARAPARAPPLSPSLAEDLPSANPPQSLATWSRRLGRRNGSHRLLSSRGVATTTSSWRRS